MAPAKFERILSVSSEDPAFPAENLLKNAYTDKKWKCKTPGEKQISVTIQLEKAEKITGVDVGNYGSAFIEILVSKSSAPDDFKVLIVASSLMTLQDSKLGQGLSGVRFFKEDNIAPDVASDKWDRIKVVCSQPYNKILQYGLSFLVVHTAGAPTNNKDNEHIGNFLLKKKDDNLSIGSLFSKQKEAKKEAKKETTGAAAIRVASTTGVIEKKVTPSVTPKRPVDTEPKDKGDQGNLDTSDLRRNAKDDRKRHKSPPARPRPASRDADSPAPAKRPKTRENDSNDSSRKKPPPARRSEKPFNRLLEGVVFAISGFQNPYRSELRSKAIQMGAKYRPDWDNTCTHLICAFPNTPKFNQVLGLGKIVTKDWVENCHSRRMRIPWRRHALHPPDKAARESEDEIYELVDRPPSPVDNRRRLSQGSSSEAGNTDDEIERVIERQKALAAQKKKGDNDKKTNSKAIPNDDGEEEDEEENESSKRPETPKEKKISKDLQTKKPEKHRKDKSSEDSNESEDKAENVPANHRTKENRKKEEKDSVKSPSKNSSMIDKTESPKNKKRETPNDKLKRSPKKKPVTDQPEDPFDMDTEEEDETADSKKFNLPTLPTIFEGKTFYIGNEIDEDESKEVRRYILAHKGVLVEEDDLNDKEINYLITVSKEEVDKVKNIQKKFTAVRPEWVWKSHDEARLAPTPSFEIN